MFMSSLNSNNTRSQMALNIPFCRTNKGHKSLPFLGPKTWNKLCSNIKTAATTVSFTYKLKKKLLKNCSSEQFHWFLLTVDRFFFFYYILCVHISSGEPNGNKNRLDLF